MNPMELIGIAFGLSMDAAAVSMCKGLAAGRVTAKHSLVAGVYFGGFQGLMPLVGYILGRFFTDNFDIKAYAPWVTFILLTLIGGNMLRESFGKYEDGCSNASFSPSAMLPLAVATSIDALATGVSYSFELSWGEMWLAIAAIGVITLVVSAIAVKLGSLFGVKYKTFAERLGGCVLIFIGIKMLLEGIGWWF